jgi:hypothetical protein
VRKKNKDAEMAKKEARECTKLQRGKCRQGLDEEAAQVMKDDDDDDDIEEEEEWTTSPGTSWHAMMTWGHPFSCRLWVQAPPALHLHRHYRGGYTYGGDEEGARHPVRAGTLQLYACPTQSGEVARTAIEMGRGILPEVPAQVGDPKRQPVEEAELGSEGLTLKCPCMVVSR